MGKLSAVITLLVCVGAIGVTTATSTNAFAHRSNVVATLRPGTPVFWDGAYLKKGTRTYSYALRVPRTSAALRVAIDTPSRTNYYRVTLIDPSGKESTRTTKRYQYSAELQVRQPKTGTWRVEVSALHVKDGVFRMRVKLARRATPSEHGLLAPDLRPIPPFDFTFSAPDDELGSDSDNNPNDSSPPPGMSCAPDEMARHDAVRCLRFSAGIENSGKGALDLRFNASDPHKRMYQVLHYAGGATRRRRAGRFEYHETHNHFHYRNIWRFELMRVTDLKTGDMTPVSHGFKSGFCPQDQRIAGWHTFDQAAEYSTLSDCGMRYKCTAQGCVAIPRTGRSHMGLSAGWGDVYGWYRPDNYVEFGLSGDGYYVVRAIVDPSGHVRETEKDDNDAYALVKVTGQSIQLLERGRGRDPWDPHKKVVCPWWRHLGAQGVSGP